MAGCSGDDTVLYLHCTETHADTYTHGDRPGGCLSTRITNILVSPIIVKPEESPGMRPNSDTQVSRDRCKNELQCIRQKKHTPACPVPLTWKRHRGNTLFPKGDHQCPPGCSLWAGSQPERADFISDCRRGSERKVLSKDLPDP